MGRVTALDEARAAAEDARARGATVVLANGAFDLLHVGHLRYLQGARALAPDGVLVVAVNSDGSVSRAKGPGRPVVPASERAELVAGIAGVDCVVVFDDDTVEAVIRALRPDIHAKGTDYTADSVPEAEVVRAHGGRVAIVGDPKDHSSSELIRAARSPTRGE